MDDHFYGHFLYAATTSLMHFSRPKIDIKRLDKCLDVDLPFSDHHSGPGAHMLRFHHIHICLRFHVCVVCSMFKNIVSDPRKETPKDLMSLFNVASRKVIPNMSSYSDLPKCL